MNVRIIGTGSYVPERVVTNEDLAAMVDTSDEWIRTRTGICQRRISEGIGVSGMAAEAARKAIENAGVQAEEIDLILLGTSTPDSCFPNGACEVQAAIGAKQAAAYDVSAACSGFLFALNTAYGFLKAGLYRNVLVIGADCLSKVVNWKDRGTCVLFGDGAGAVVVKSECEAGGTDRIGGIIAAESKAAESKAAESKAAESKAVEDRNKLHNSGIFHMIMGSDGRKGPVLACTSRTVGNFLTGTEPELGYMTMDGQEVFKFAVKKVPEMIETLLKESQTDLAEVKYFVLHQANYRISEAAAKRLHVSMDRVPVNIDRYGNTSGASVPLLLDELNRAGKLQKGDLLVLAGFGAGLTWGATLLRW